MRRWMLIMRRRRLKHIYKTFINSKRLLRAFFTYPEKGFTESELERIAGIPQASVHRNVKSLMDNGLLDRKRIGKANLYSLNREHILYKLLSSNFEAERNVLVELKNMIEESVKSLPQIELAVLFGSILKGMERADSDVDIFILDFQRNVKSS